ncbi:uncharacterized protein LOC108664819, partial [Hyalella azteca]|uniref:Uncharacterized protein LOC108664819 n=1 Tax=Hyalella azteca TaxID=294128 RepID=A0A8B7MZK0_HYAAZ
MAIRVNVIFWLMCVLAWQHCESSNRISGDMCLWSSLRGGDSVYEIVEHKMQSRMDLLNQYAWRPGIYKHTKNGKSVMDYTSSAKTISTPGKLWEIKLNDVIQNKSVHCAGSKCTSFNTRNGRRTNITSINFPSTHLEHPIKAQMSLKEENNLDRDTFLDCFLLSQDNYWDQPQASDRNSHFRNYRLSDVIDMKTRQPLENFTSSDGIVLRVLHETSGSTLLHVVFQTWQYFTFGAHLRWWLEKLQPGRIAVLTVRRIGVPGLWFIEKYLKESGSLFVDTVPTTNMWTWAWVVGGRTLIESTAKYKSDLFAHKIFSFANNEAKHNKNQILEDKKIVAFESKLSRSGQHRMRGNLTLQPQIHRYFNNHSPITNNNMNFFTDQMKMREKLCDSCEGLGEFCSYIFHSELLKRINSPQENSGPKIAIVVLAGIRVEYILHTLTHLFSSIGVDKKNVVVMVGRSFNDNSVNRNVLLLLNSLTIPYQITPDFEILLSLSATSLGKSFYYYKSAFKLALEYYSADYKYFALLDEDVEVSKDWLRYLQYTAPLLDTDTSLWCATGSGGVLPAGKDPKRVYRAQRQPGWGFMVTRAVLEAATRQMLTGDVALYDMWLLNTFSKGRECVFPEVARSRHYGVGINTIPQVHHIYSLEVTLYQGPPLKMTPLIQLTRENYRKKIVKEISSAEVYSENPCKSNFLAKTAQHGKVSLVFPFLLNSSTDFFNWTLLAECIGLYGYSPPHAPYFAVPLTLPLNNTLYIIGVPISPFTELIHKNFTLWTPTFLEDGATQFFYPLPRFLNH